MHENFGSIIIERNLAGDGTQSIKRGKQVNNSRSEGKNESKSKTLQSLRDYICQNALIYGITILYKAMWHIALIIIELKVQNVIYTIDNAADLISFDFFAFIKLISWKTVWSTELL